MIPKNVKDICELFDCTVCTDLAIRGREPKNETDYPKGLKPCYYLGEQPEYAAGLRGYSLSPHFFTMTALERYCKSQKGRDAINKAAGETFDGWDTKLQKWEDCI